MLASLDEAQRLEVLSEYTDEQLAALLHDWGFWGRPDQQLPDGYWFVWLILAGRGWGKTRTAVEVISELVRGPTPLQAPPGAPAIMTIIADSPFDMRQYTIEGPSGFLNVGPRDFRPLHEPSKKTLTWPNGCKALLFSAEDPETLRGASGSFFWWDELAKSRYAKEGWMNMLFGMREGKPRGIVTTTPKPNPLLKELMAKESTHITRGSTWDNKDNLSEIFYNEVIKPMMGTRIGRQEIEAELLTDVPGALWTRQMIEDCRVAKPEGKDAWDEFIDGFVRIVVSMDPAVSNKENSDEMGIVVGGLHENGNTYILEDLSEKLSPDQAARKAIKAYDRYKADRIVGEVNNGGEWIGQTIRLTAAAMKSDGSRDSDTVSYKAVHASRGKKARAEPAAALYEQNTVKHVGCFPKLEDQLCEWEPANSTSSPDRLDAVVWLLTELVLSVRNRKRQGLTMASVPSENTESVLFGRSDRGLM